MIRKAEYEHIAVSMQLCVVCVDNVSYVLSSQQEEKYQNPQLLQPVLELS